MSKIKVILYTHTIVHFDEGASKLIEKTKTQYFLGERLVYERPGIYSSQNDTIAHLREGVTLCMVVRGVTD